MNKALFSDESRRFAGATIRIILAPDNRYKFGDGNPVPLTVCVTHQRQRRYFSTGVKVSTVKEYEALFSKSNAAIETRKNLRKTFDHICVKVDELITLNRFSVADLKTHIEKSEGKVTEKTLKADDTFSYWATLGASKEKVKTRAMYSSALDWFKLFRKDKPILLGAVDTAIITRFSKWLDEQKARNGTDQPLSLDTRMVILRATRAVFNQAFKDGHTMTVPNFKGLIHVGNRRRLNALTVEEVLRLWEYWLAAPDKQSKYARAVGRWLLLYCLNGMNTIDMAKLIWTDKAAPKQNYPQFTFIRSKIDRANKPIGKQLDETSVPIIPQLRQLLDVYASPYVPGELVFPDIFLNAVTDEQRAIRVHDYNRRISKNIKDVCEQLGIQSVTPQYARNSFISALAHHGVMTAYIDYAVGHATSEVSALLAGYISNVTPAMMQAFNEKIFIVPPIQ
ncbi:MAG: site-specific integrase [Bacteroides sp.]|nr:site-specific integrase [Bacteroides sp.]